MISYKPLKKLLIDADKTTKDLIELKILTPNNSVYVNQDSGYLNLRTIDRICNYLSTKLGRPVKIDEILEFTPDKPIEVDEAIE